MYELRDDYLVPSYDLDCWSALKAQTTESIKMVLRHVKGRDLVVQAGGNFGVWPKLFASEFISVYTFEPDEQNFPCLAYNTRENTNVFRFQAALRDTEGWVDLRRHIEQHNAGAQTVNGHGRIPAMKLDSFGFERCDLIYLDIEGSEPYALFGARNTISRHKPVIAIEDKSIADGAVRNEAIQMLYDFGYKQVDSIHRDKVFAC